MWRSLGVWGGMQSVSCLAPRICARLGGGARVGGTLHRAMCIGGVDRTYGGTASASSRRSVRGPMRRHPPPNRSARLARGEGDSSAGSSVNGHVAGGQVKNDGCVRHRHSVVAVDAGHPSRARAAPHRRMNHAEMVGEATSFPTTTSVPEAMPTSSLSTDVKVIYSHEHYCRDLWAEVKRWRKRRTRAAGGSCGRGGGGGNDFVSGVQKRSEQVESDQAFGVLACAIRDHGVRRFVHVWGEMCEQCWGSWGQRRGGEYSVLHSAHAAQLRKSLQAMTAAVGGERVPWGQLLSVCSNGRAATAALVWEEMERAGVEPTRGLFCALLRAMARARHAGWLEYVAGRMQSKGVGVPDESTASVVVTSLGRSGAAARARALVHAWQAELPPGVSLGERAYAALVDALAREGRHTAAAAVATDLQAAGLGFGDILRMALVRAHCMAGELQRAGRVAAVGGQDVHNTLLWALAKGGKVDEAMRLQVEIEGRGWRVNEGAWNGLLRANLDVKGLADAEVVVDKMAARGVAVRRWLVGRLVEANVTAGHVERARELLEVMNTRTEVGLHTTRGSNVT